MSYNNLTESLEDEMINEISDHDSDSDSDRKCIADKTCMKYKVICSLGSTRNVTPETESESIFSEENESPDSDVNLNKYEPIGFWGSYGIDPKPWSDKDRPIAKFRKYEDITCFTEEERQGILSKRIVASCLSYLEQCPENGQYTLCKCVLKNKNLIDISVLNSYRFLQYLDLSFNKLDDVSLCGKLKFLMYLDVSHNKIEKLLNFKPPFNLTFVNYSHNLITDIPQLSNFWSIKSLNLSHNSIKLIKGLKKLRYLETLNLSHNQIEQIENLDHLHIQTLNLESNKITNFKCDCRIGFKTMPYLSYVKLGHNYITSLAIFEGANFVQSIDMEDNCISNLLELAYLKDLKLLISVNFYKNPIRNYDNYYLISLENIERLQFLDGNRVCTKDKVYAKSEFQPCLKLQALDYHANLLAISHLTKFPNLGLHVLPADQPVRPLIVVVGPIAGGQDYIIKKFADKHKKNIFKLTCHTDRDPHDNESNQDFYFVTRKEFSRLLESGEIFMMYDVLNCNYGLSYQEFARGCSEVGKVMIVQSDVHAALTLQIRGYQPYILLALPKSKHIHRRWLIETYQSNIFNIRFPEAAVKIQKRDDIYSTTSMASSSSDETELTNYNSEEVLLQFKYCGADSFKERTCHSEHESDNKIYPSRASVEQEQVYEQIQVQEEENVNNDYDKLGQCSTCQLCTSPILPQNISSDYSFFNQISKTQAEQLPDAYSNLEIDEESRVKFPVNLVEDFYQKVLESREIYMEFHRMNPGLFYDIIFTDETDTALEKLKNIAKAAMKKFRECKVETSYPSLGKIFEERMKMLQREMENATIRTTCGKQ